MTEQLSRLNLTGSRVEAVTPAQISAEDIERYCSREKPVFLRENELACTLSHEAAWRAMLASGYDRALILEDDAVLSQLLPALLDEAGGIDADLIRIETILAPVRVFPTDRRLNCGVDLRTFRSTPFGAAGYILRASAAEILLAAPAMRTTPIDVALYDPFEQPGKSLTRLLTEPGLCQQLALTGQVTGGVAASDLRGDGLPHAFARKRPVRYGISRALAVARVALRNALDHFIQLPKGIERRIIPFQP